MPTTPRIRAGAYGASEPARDRRGRDTAKLFRQYRLTEKEREQRRCDLDAILEADGLEVCPAQHAGEEHYAACLLRIPGGGGGIMIASDQDGGRRRFSLAHELGHYHMPWHAEQGQMLQCADADLRTRSKDARVLEWQANDFATELLMPQRLFAADIARRDISFETTILLARPDMYDVSLTAAAWRMVDLTREQCALVVTIDGVVQWIVHSSAWTFPLAERRQPLPTGSISSLVAAGDSPNHRRESVDPGLWLSSPDGRTQPGNDVELFESTHTIPRLGQTLTLLWAINE